MPHHHEARWLPHSPEQLYDLVADVRLYPEFLPWISAVRVRSNGPTEMLADVVIGFKGLRETFTSKVRKSRPGSIHVDYIEGPLKFLRNDWAFRAERGGCMVDFTVDFAFKSRVFETIAGQVFGAALRRMIGAFETRAAKLYGAPAPVGISRSSAHSAA